MYKQLPLAALCLLFCASSVDAQDSFGRSSTASIGVTNNGFETLSYTVFNSDGSDTGSAVSAAVDNLSFDGFNGMQQSDSLSFSGSAFADANYGVMKTSAVGRVENSFYNSDNPFYFNPDTGEVNESGTPDRFLSVGQAIYEDRFVFSPNSGTFNSAVKANFFYQIDGTISGASSFFSIFVEGDDDSDFIILQSSQDGPFINQTWVTKKFEIGADFALNHRAVLLSQFDMSAEFYDDGQTIEGSSDFANTVTLAGVSLFDANDAQIGSFQLTSDSGTVYPTAAVPEPSTLSLLMGIAGMVFLKRRKTQSSAQLHQ